MDHERRNFFKSALALAFTAGAVCSTVATAPKIVWRTSSLGIAEELRRCGNTDFGVATCSPLNLAELEKQLYALKRSRPYIDPVMFYVKPEAKKPLERMIRRFRWQRFCERTLALDG